MRAETEGEKAFATARKFKPDMIFLDVIMPDVDGGEIAEKIKSDRDFKSVAIVFLTAIVKGNEALSRKGIIVCGYPYPCLAKPVTVSELIDCIKENIP